jgi:hypothetical protein
VFYFELPKTTTQITCNFVAIFSGFKRDRKTRPVSAQQLSKMSAYNLTRLKKEQQREENCKTNEYLIYKLDYSKPNANEYRPKSGNFKVRKR